MQCRGARGGAHQPLPAIVSLCGHKRVTNWLVKPGLQLWCVVITVAKSSRPALVNQAVRVGRRASSSALLLPSTAADNAVQPPGEGGAFMPLPKVFSVDMVRSCTWRGRQIWPDILSRIMLRGVRAAAGRGGCSFVLLRLEASTHVGMLPGKHNCTVSRCFLSVALHFLLLGGAGRRTRKWWWKSIAKNGQDQVRKSHIADELLAP